MVLLELLVNDLDAVHWDVFFCTDEYCLLQEGELNEIVDNVALHVQNAFCLELFVVNEVARVQFFRGLRINHIHDLLEKLLAVVV